MIEALRTSWNSWASVRCYLRCIYTYPCSHDDDEFFMMGLVDVVFTDFPIVGWRFLLVFNLIWHIWCWFWYKVMILPHFLSLDTRIRKQRVSCIIVLSVCFYFKNAPPPHLILIGNFCHDVFCFFFLIILIILACICPPAAGICTSCRN